MEKDSWTFLPPMALPFLLQVILTTCDGCEFFLLFFLQSQPHQ